VKLATASPPSPDIVRPGWRLLGLPTEDEIRAAFSPMQAEILLALVSRPSEKHVSAGEAAELVGWTYDTFRKEPAFDLANVAPQRRRKRYAVTKLRRIADNLRRKAS
jgi:hypothetical protein